MTIYLDLGMSAMEATSEFVEKITLEEARALVALERTIYNMNEVIKTLRGRGIDVAVRVEEGDSDANPSD